MLNGKNRNGVRSAAQRVALVSAIFLGSISACASSPVFDEPLSEPIGTTSEALTPNSGPVTKTPTTNYPDFLDFLISNVCLTSDAGAVTGEDPAKCSSGKSRDIRIGESFPYLRHIISFPVRGVGQRTFVAVFQDTLKSVILPGISAAASRREYIVSNGSGDGLETLSIEAEQNTSPQHSSIVFTQAGIAFDPTTNVYKPPQYWTNSDSLHSCDTVEAWYGLPYDLVQSGNVFQAYSYYPRDLGTAPLSCIPAKQPGLAVANWWSQKFDFGNSIPLGYISVDNWAAPTAQSAPARNESFYFTREYGYTRHESWIRQDGPGMCQNTPLSPSPCLGAANAYICDGTTNPTKPAMAPNPPNLLACTGPWVEVAFGCTYWRAACEDAYLDYEAADVPLHPYVLPLPDDIRDDNNLLAAGDWSGPHDLGFNPGTYDASFGGGPTTAPWEKVGATNWSWKVVRPPVAGQSTLSPLNNNRIQFSCSGACSANAIINPNPASFGVSGSGGSFAKFYNSGNRTIQYGAVVKGTPGAQGTMSLLVYNQAKTLVGSWSHPVTHDGNDHLVEFNFNATFSGSNQPYWFSFQYSFATSGAQYELDEAYVVAFTP